MCIRRINTLSAAAESVKSLNEGYRTCISDISNRCIDQKPYAVDLLKKSSLFFGGKRIDGTTKNIASSHTVKKNKNSHKNRGLISED
jgi:hypothetical protein